MTIAVRHSPELQRHLETFEHDGATVAALLFEGGRLSYPGRRSLEHGLGYVEPYTLAHESRVIEGLSFRTVTAIRYLAALARHIPNDGWTTVNDPTLELLWTVHEAWDPRPISSSQAWHPIVSLDRVVAALVMVNFAMNNRQDETVERAAELVVGALHANGFPPTEEGLEELFDGAAPACVGLGLVEL